MALATAACTEASLSELSSPLPWQPAEAEVVVSFTFDDGYDSQLRGARILEGDPGTAAEDSFRGTFFIVSGSLRRTTDVPGRMTPADVQALYAAGHEIGGHSVTHADLAALAVSDPYELRRQVCNDRRVLEALGVRPVGFAYPHGRDTGVHQVAEDCGYSYARDADGLVLPPRAGIHAETVPPTSRFDVAALASISSVAAVGSDRQVASTAAGLQAWIEAVRGNGGGWVNLTLHHLRDGCGLLEFCMEESELRAIVAWLRTRPAGVAVRTMEQVMLGDPLIANPSLEVFSGVRPTCWKRVGNELSFAASGEHGRARTGAHGEILRPLPRSLAPIVEIEGDGRGCALPVSPGRRYEVRAFARCVSPVELGAQAAGRLVISFKVDGVWQPRIVGPTVAATSEWTPLSLVSPPVPANATALVFGVQYANGVVGQPELHVDDFSIVER